MTMDERRMSESRPYVRQPFDRERCTLCGDCAEACEFNALAVSKERVLLFSDLCHGCGVCSYVCPESGVRETCVELISKFI